MRVSALHRPLPRGAGAIPLHRTLDKRPYDDIEAKDRHADEEDLPEAILGQSLADLQADIHAEESGDQPDKGEQAKFSGNRPPRHRSGESNRWRP